MLLIQYFGWLLLLLTLWMPHRLQADDFSSFNVEAKVFAFYPSSARVRHIYSNAIANYELEVSQTFCNRWQVWLNGGYLDDEGRSLGLENRTTLRLIPVAVGIKYIFPIGHCVDLYAGAGACWSSLRIRDHSPFVHEHISQSALGAVFKLGIIYNLTQCLYATLSTEYLCQHFSFHHHYEDHYTKRHNLDMSGFKFGGGLGFTF